MLGAPKKPMLLVTKLILSLCAVLALVQAPVSAETVFENQSDVGNALNIPVHKWSDATRSTKAIVVAVPGLVFDGRAYDALANHLSQNGYVVYSADMRGYGDWLKPGAKFAGDSLIHYMQSKDDLTHVLTNLRKRYPHQPIFCLGESFGANYVVWEASTEPQLMDGAVAFGLSYKICVHPRARWFLTFGLGLAHPKKPQDLGPYLEPILSDDKHVTLAALQHPDTMSKLSAVDLVKATVTTKRCIRSVKNIPAGLPVLVVAGENDQIQKSNRLKELVSSMGSKRSKLVLLPNKGHLLLERPFVEPEVLDVLENWLDNQTQRYAAVGNAISQR